MTQAMPDQVARVFETYSNEVRTGAATLRDLIFDVAASDLKIGPVEETLKWGQPAYLTDKGSTLRIGPHKQASFAIFAHCQSSIIASYAQAFPGWDKLDGNRAVLFDDPNQIEPERLTHLIRHALTYHVVKTTKA